ncbi:MAG: hypothetical protein IJO13_07630, partial [Lachnospiraceae bacterium]|nr:hypothetical protein [Lachnospiraceae bacterium]
VEPNVNAWMIYARKHEIHGAISAFLESHKSMFYSVKETEYGQEYVTARGWEDLSKTLQLYEYTELPVSLVLIRQYITDRLISELFYEYYLVYRKYQEKGYDEMIFSGYQTLAGINIMTLEIENRFALINQLLARLSVDFKERYHLNSLRSYLTSITEVLNQTYQKNGKLHLIPFFEKEIESINGIIKQGEAGGTISSDSKHIYLDMIEILNYWKENFTDTRRNDLRQLLHMITTNASERTIRLSDLQDQIEKKLSNAESFIRKHWGTEEILFYRSGLENLKYKDVEVQKTVVQVG